jgi:hypothetical protein
MQPPSSNSEKFPLKGQTTQADDSDLCAKGTVLLNIVNHARQRKFVSRGVKEWVVAPMTGRDAVIQVVLRKPFQSEKVLELYTRRTVVIAQIWTGKKSRRAASEVGLR